MNMPSLIERYGCAEYYEEGYAARGYTSQRDGSILVVPEPQIQEILEHAFLAIGRAGGGATLVGFRAGLPGVWLYRPAPRSFEPVAGSIDEMIVKYETGRIVG